jgi:hypothetical protein
MRTGPSRSAVLWIATAVLLGSAACADAGPHVLGEAPLEISNDTTISVVLVVNGTAVRTVPPHTADKIAPEALPRLPWSVEARSIHSQTLVSLTVRAGQVRQTAVASGIIAHQSPTARAALTCGIVELWSGVQPFGGPFPGPGHPGDCD